MPLKFGTSGIRGLVTEMTDQACSQYTQAFIQYLKSRLPDTSPTAVAIAGDLRSSTPRIMRAAAYAIQQAGLEVINCGHISTPAVTHYAMQRGFASLMVTGSHIPDDRNGIKFNLPWGEVLKSDEIEISKQYQAIIASPPKENPFDADGFFLPGAAPALGSAADDGMRDYYRRFTEYFPTNSLQGLRVVFYQHSSVSRDALPAILSALGAEVVSVGHSNTFVPVDTEAVEDPDQLAAWVAEYHADALVTTDGDGDRPLVVTENGTVVRGDVLGILVAGYLNADAVATPVSCNTALEKSGHFSHIIRTKIGSPYVVEAMEEAIADDYRCVVGYEANGGFLLASDLVQPSTGKKLLSLPTRDAALPILSILLAARKAEKTLSQLIFDLPNRYTASGLLRDFPNQKGHALVNRFQEEGIPYAESVYSSSFGPIAHLDFTDGARATFTSSEILHIRPSGNAPEFRCYTEAGSPERAEEMNQMGLDILADLKDKLD